MGKPDNSIYDNFFSEFKNCAWDFSVNFFPIVRKVGNFGFYVTWNCKVFFGYEAKDNFQCCNSTVTLFNGQFWLVTVIFQNENIFSRQKSIINQTFHKRPK